MLSLSSYTVSIIICSAGRICLSAATQSMPDIAGRRISISTTSGFRVGITRSASSAEGQAPTQRMPGAELRIFTSCSRNPLSSSTTMTDLAITDGEANAAPGAWLAVTRLNPRPLGRSGIGFMTAGSLTASACVCSSNPRQPTLMRALPTSPKPGRRVHPAILISPPAEPEGSLLR
jgi:hypothetical protein